jgi:hypothetical protein
VKFVKQHGNMSFYIEQVLAKELKIKLS